MSPEEAELAKQFTNVWRYIKFATARADFFTYERARHAG